MGLNCGASCAKYILFAFNIIFFLGGAAVLGVGIWLRVSSDSFVDVLEKLDPAAANDLVNTPLASRVELIHTVAYILIGVGAFVFAVGFMGCCGAVKEWRPLLVGYAICLIIIVGLEVGTGIAVGVYKSEVTNWMAAEMRGFMSHYDFVETTVVDGKLNLNQSTVDPRNVAQTATMNSLQVLFGCCGIRNYTVDYDRNTPYYRHYNSTPYFTEIPPPVFCCQFSDPFTLQLKNEECGRDENKRTNWDTSNYNIGCVEKVTKLVDSNAPIVIGVTVGIGLVELIGVFFAFCLCCAIGHEKNGKRYY